MKNMETHLTIKHLAPYLPYGLKVLWIRKDDNKLVVNKLSISYYNFLIKTKYAKPILRPLSDLTKEIEVNGEKFVPIDVIYKIWYEKDLSPFSKRILKDKICFHTESMPYWLVQKLLEWHFNVFKLPENLYVNYNDTKK